MTENENQYISLRIAVPTEYEDVFSHFYFAENKSSETISKTFLPSYQSLLVFNFGEKITLQTTNNRHITVNRCFVLGPVKKPFIYSLPPNAQMLVANFKDDAFYRLFGNASVAEQLPLNPNDLVEEDCFTAVWTELNKMTDIQHRVDFILEFCKPYLRDRNTITQKLASLTDENQSPIKYLANQQKQTERNIQHQYKKYFGYSSKEFSRYQRFIKAIQIIQNSLSSSNKVDWFDVIDQCGYYDQSQLIRDFKHYLDISPTKYLKFQQDICMAKAD
jgi:AraC-like DNA-binding protein